MSKETNIDNHMGYSIVLTSWLVVGVICIIVS